VAFVERRAELLAKLRVVDDAWRKERCSGLADRPIERVLAPALRRAAAAGRLAGLRDFEAPAFGLEGALLRALAQCTALTRLSLGDNKWRDQQNDVCYAFAGDSSDSLRAIGSQLAALRGLQELGLGFGCTRAAAPALAGLSALTRLTSLRLTLTDGRPTSAKFNPARIKLSRKWSL
jgi:hypothetical protein